MKANTQQEQVFTPEQKEAIMKALDDPEKKRAVIATLRAAGLLRE